MKLLKGLAIPMLHESLKLIFLVPNPTNVERYLKKWSKLSFSLSRLPNDQEKESLYYEILKFNRQVQAEWFQGKQGAINSIPLKYQDRYNELHHKHIKVHK
jgi:hypothetical protein